jgi:hypothetical protein
VEYAKLTALHPNLDFCQLIGRNTYGEIDQGNKAVAPCKATYDGPHTDLNQPPLTDFFGR